MKKSATRAQRDRGVYLRQAYINAFGKYGKPDCYLEQDFAANRDRIVKPYNYYQNTYLKEDSL
jgi:hypothetical protein